jgi:hypothetical protein
MVRPLNKIKGETQLCDFCSWIEKGDDILFLTGNDVFNSKRGLELQKYCKSKDDLTGHGAIRWYFGTDDKPIIDSVP